MCGIFGYVGYKKNAADIVLEGLKRLEYRGYDSWGVAEVPIPSGKIPVSNAKEAKIIVKKKAGAIGRNHIRDLPPSDFALGHTRWATHGGVTDINAHPHLDCTGTVAIIHNGIIENYDVLKKTLIRQGHRFVTETDTEVAAHLIEEYAKKFPFAEAVRHAFNSLLGLNAIIAITSSQPTFVAARLGSPLIIGIGDGENFLASDASALLPHTRSVYFMEDGEFATVTKDHVEISSVKSNAPKKWLPLTLHWTLHESEKGKYPHFMLKEIYEQPKMLTQIAQASASEIKRLAQIIKKAYGTYMVACGSASYVSIAGSYLFSKIAKRHVNWAVGSEFGYQLDFLTPKSLVIALSQSGETMDTLESVKKAKERGTKVFALVNVLGSTLYRMADYKMLIGAGPEKAVASTKALTGKLAHLTLLAYALTGKLPQGRNVVDQAAHATQSLFTPRSLKKIQQLAKKLKHSEHIYVIGRGLSYPASLETAIKIKEISYIHAEGMAAGELKHGPLALVEKGTPCIAFLPNDETYGANLAGAMEMKARGGYIIGISYKPHEVFDYYLHVTDASEATIIPNIVVGQLLSYYLTIERGLDPDRPRNLAKSVTVK